LTLYIAKEISLLRRMHTGRKHAPVRKFGYNVG